MKNEWYIIGRGINGWHANGINVSSSGGDLLPTTWWVDKHIVPGYAADAIDGAFVYDASELTGDALDAFITAVVCGPMVNTSLDPEAWIAGFTNDEPADRTTYRGLDYVGIARYERFMRESIPTARFGHIRNGICEWEEEQPI